MADIGEDEELELDVNQTKNNKMITILLIVLIVLILLMGGVGAWLFLNNDSNTKKSSNSNKNEGKVDIVKVEEEIEEELGPLVYFTLVPEFVVNFPPASKVRYLQIDLQVATRDEAALEIVDEYRPVIRNDILVLLSRFSYEELRDRDGKKTLQQKILNTINRIVSAIQNSKNKNESNDDYSADSEDTTGAISEDKKQDGYVEGPIENVYFTSFIMQ